MRWVVVLRRGFYGFALLLLLVSLLGIYLTGPVVVRGERFPIEAEPSAERLRARVETLVEDFGPRDNRHPDNLMRAADWIAENMRAAHLEVEPQDYTIAAGTYRNVVGLRRGSDPEAGAIVVGAHYDTVEGSPGADDNASGVAVMLELIRTLPAAPPRRTHYFVAFGTQEPPFLGTDEMGSYVFARRLRDEGVDVELMVALDLVGYYSNDPGSQSFPTAAMRLFYPGKADWVAVVGDSRSGRAIGRAKRGMMGASRIPIHSFRAPAGSGLAHLSDDQSFRRLDMPAVLITDTAFMRYGAYHRPSDTGERLRYDRMAELVLALHGILWEH